MRKNWYCEEDERGLSSCFQVPLSCGDGVHDLETEGCDDGNRENGDGCLRNCKEQNKWTCATNEAGLSECSLIPETCGDGVVDEDEECDDGNRVNGDGCRRNC